MCRLIFVVLIGLKYKYVVKFIGIKNCIVAMSTRENPMSLFLNKEEIPLSTIVCEINIGEVYENNSTC